MVLGACSSWSSSSPQVVQTRVRITPAALLGRIRRMRRFHLLPGACCLGGADTQEVAPPSLVSRCVAARITTCPVVQIATVAVRLRCWTAAEVGGLKSLNADRVVLTRKHQCHPQLEIAASPSDVLLLSGALSLRLRSPLDVLRAAGDPLVGPPQRTLHSTVCRVPALKVVRTVSATAPAAVRAACAARHPLPSCAGCCW